MRSAAGHEEVEYKSKALDSPFFIQYFETKHCNVFMNGWVGINFIIFLCLVYDIILIPALFHTLD